VAGSMDDEGSDMPLSQEDLLIQRGLVNGSDQGPTPGMEVEVGLINGLPAKAQGEAKTRPALLGRWRKRDRAAREALERRAAQPLPSSDGD